MCFNCTITLDTCLLFVFYCYIVTSPATQLHYHLPISFALFFLWSQWVFFFFCISAVFFSTSTFRAFTAFFYFLVLLSCIAFDLSGPPYSLHWPGNKPNRYSCVKRYHYENAQRTTMHPSPTLGLTRVKGSYWSQCQLLRYKRQGTPLGRSAWRELMQTLRESHADMVDLNLEL